MMLQNNHVRRLNPNNGSRKATPSTDRALLNGLLKLWKRHNQHDIQLRLVTGLRINRHIGPPTARQSYRQRTINRLANRLGVSRSDVSRMRWFAFHFGSIEKLKRAHPGVQNWSQVKVLLTRLRHPKAGNGTKKPRRSKSASGNVRRFVSALATVRDQLNRLHVNPGSHEWHQACRAADRIVSAIGKYLGVHYVQRDCTSAQGQTRVTKLSAKDVESRKSGLRLAA
jgi:hypothetical protein